MDWWTILDLGWICTKDDFGMEKVLNWGKVLDRR